MSRVRRLVARPAQVSGVLPLVHLRRRLDEVEESLEETLRHEQGLRREVARIEATLARVAANRAAARDEGHPGS